MYLTLENLQEARTRIAPYIRNTELAPIILPNGDTMLIKMENLQATGSFKVRGAANKILQLTSDEKAHGVIASSAGNHAQGVARAAKKANIACTIVMPRSAPIAKIAATESYGAKVVLAGDGYDACYAHACEIQAETGAIFIHPFDDEEVIAGQASVGLEILEQAPDVEQLLVPIGGGGLASGVAFAAKLLRPDIKVVGVEPIQAASMHRSILAGQITTLNSANTIADGIAVKTPGLLTYEYCQRFIDDIIEVSEDEIASTVLFLMEKAKSVSEGAGAAAIAAAYTNKVDTKLKTVGILSGGNIDINMMSRIISRGLLNSGRKLRITLTLSDQPGELARLSSIIASAGANVVAIHYDRTNILAKINDTVVDVELETRNQECAEEVIRILKEEGYHFLSQQHEA